MNPRTALSDHPHNLANSLAERPASSTPNPVRYLRQQPLRKTNHRTHPPILRVLHHRQNPLAKTTATYADIGDLVGCGGFGETTATYADFGDLPLRRGLASFAEGVPLMPVGARCQR